jgi:hypothetical protein
VRFVSRGLPLLVVAALAACGGAAPDDGGPAYVSKADLAVMVLPQDELGSLADGFEIALDESGWTSHTQAAKDTLDPADSAASLTARGRVAGYHLAYEQAKPARRRGRLLVATSVELLRDDIYASEFLNKQADDFVNREGLSHSGVKLAGVRVFDIPGAGDEAAGVRAVLRAEGRKEYFTLALLRRGRIVGVVGVLSADEERLDAEVVRLAKALDRRIQNVLAGRIEADPVPLPPS